VLLIEFLNCAGCIGGAGAAGALLAAVCTRIGCTGGGGGTGLGRGGAKSVKRGEEIGSTSGYSNGIATNTAANNI
jgi:hypothetical protein